MWHHHFEFLLLGYGAYMTFFDFCKKAFPEISDQTISRMVAGIEAEIFRPDEEVKRLARRAVELGVDDEVPATACDTEDDPRRARQARRRRARRGSSELETCRNPWFNVNVGDGFYHYHRSLERRPVACRSRRLPGYIEQGQGGRVARAADRAAAGASASS